MIDGLQIQVLSGRALDPLRWAAALRPAGGLAFFDSALPHETLGRYSFVMADPFHRIAANGSALSVDGRELAGDPFALLADLMTRYAQQNLPGLPPFQGGLAGSFGYGLRHHLEKLPRHRLDDQPIPDLVLGAYDLVVTDIDMPRMNGMELLAAIKKSDPDVEVLVRHSGPETLLVVTSRRADTYSGVRADIVVDPSGC